jgi:hypothetical protein
MLLLLKYNTKECGYSIGRLYKTELKKMCRVSACRLYIHNLNQDSIIDNSDFSSKKKCFLLPKDLKKTKLLIFPKVNWIYGSKTYYDQLCS